MIGRDELLADMREHGLILKPEGLRLDESGADFLVAHAVDEEGCPWIVRVPRRPHVMEAAAGESRALGFVRKHLPVAVPEWRLNAESVIAYPRLAGTPAATVDPAGGGYLWHIDLEPVPAAFIDSLAETLVTLHGIDVGAAAQAGVPVVQPIEIRSRLSKQMDETRKALDVPEPVWQRWQAWLSDDTYWPKRSALMHGDLHPPHLLVDDASRLVGLLDWTESQVADAATDFSLMYGIMGGAVLDRLLTRYENAGGHVWPRMREHIVERWFAYPTLIAVFAMRSGNDAFLDFARVMANEQQASG